MSLLVHLPLMGDLRNIGLAGDITMTNHGATVNNTGKLGQCYEFDGTDDRIFTTDLVLGNMWSIAIWFKDDATTTTWGGICTLNSNGSDSDLQFGIYVKPSESRLQSSANGRYNSQIRYDPGRWNHIVNTFDGTTCKTYINGNHVNSFVGGSFLQRSNLTIGGRSTYISGAGTGAGVLFKGCLNDFRLYDHVLSLREVKELSKGLVAHWKLDDLIGNENLLSVVPRSHNATAYNAYQLNLSENLVAGQTYTMQLWDVDVSHSEKTDAQTGVCIYWGGGSVTLGSWYGTANFTNGHADHLVKIFTVTSANANGSGASNAWLNLYNSVGYVAGTMNMKIGRWKLEKGSTPTPWIPAKSDTMYSDWEFNVAHDSSGYCHDGEQIGDVSVSSSTPRYLSGTHIESLDHTTNRYNVNLSCLKMPIEMITPEELTITFWGNLALGYGNGWQGVFSFSNSTWPTDYLAAAINQYDSNFCFNSSDGSSHVRLANNLITVAGEWHHYALTYDGKTCRAYRDGELKTSGTFSADTALGSFTHLFMGLSVAGSVWRKNTCDYSDVRVYATALSADDIKELYNTSASIDNHHNVYAREFVEK